MQKESNQERTLPGPDERRKILIHAQKILMDAQTLLVKLEESTETSLLELGSSQVLASPGRNIRQPILV
jgi:hypothetical protein